MKPKVVLLSQEVHPIPPLKGAAVEQWIDSVAHRMREHEPHVVSVPHPERPDEETVGGVRYHRIRQSALYKRLFRKLTRLDPHPYVARVARYARGIGASIVHVHNAPQFVDALAAALPEASIVLHMHNEKNDLPAATIEHFVGCSDYVVRWFRARKLQARGYSVIPNGVDADAFRGSRAVQRRALRERMGVPLDRVVVLYVGRISPEKGPERLVEAFRSLDPQQFHLVLIGEWPQGSAGRSERVRYADALKTRLSAAFCSVVDVVPPERMAALYALGDIVVIPSRFEEPFSMVAIEAMACGVPLIAVRRGGMAEYLRDGENAIVLEAEAEAAVIAQAIRDLAADRRLRARLAVAARRFVTQHYRWERVVEQTEGLYRKLRGART